MDRQLLFELLQDRAFFFLLNGLSSLSCKQIHQSRIDSIHYQIGTLLGSGTILRHWNGLCPCFVITRNPPICILMLNGIGENKVQPLCSKFLQNLLHRRSSIQPVIPIMGTDRLLNGNFAEKISPGQKASMRLFLHA